MRRRECWLGGLHSRRDDYYYDFEFYWATFWCIFATVAVKLFCGVLNRCLELVGCCDWRQDRRCDSEGLRLQKWWWVVEISGQDVLKLRLWLKSNSRLVKKIPAWFRITCCDWLDPRGSLVPKRKREMICWVSYNILDRILFPASSSLKTELYRRTISWLKFKMWVEDKSSCINEVEYARCKCKSMAWSPSWARSEHYFSFRTFQPERKPNFADDYFTVAVSYSRSYATCLIMLSIPHEHLIHGSAERSASHDCFTKMTSLFLDCQNRKWFGTRGIHI